MNTTNTSTSTTIGTITGTGTSTSAPSTTTSNTTTAPADTISVTRSKRGLPCLWEKGGGLTNTGDAQIIADNMGYPKRAIYVRTYGDLACVDHALIPVQAGDHVVTVRRHRDKVAVRVDRIVSIGADVATLAPEGAPICYGAIEAAVEKSGDYHCRRPYYIQND